MRVTAGLGFLISTSISVVADSPPPSADTLNRARPVFCPALILKNTILFPGSLNARLVYPAPSTLTNPVFSLTETVAFCTFFSMANTSTGNRNVSPGPSTRGSVGKTMSGFFTGTVFSALPWAPETPALAGSHSTAITLTEPT